MDTIPAHAEAEPVATRRARRGLGDAAPRSRRPRRSAGRAPGQSDRLPWAALLVMALTGFLLIATETMPAGLLPQIAAGLATSEGTAGQLVSAYALGTILATIPLVAATRGMRRKPVFVVGVLGFLVVNTVTALSSDIALSLVMRLLAGAFSGLLWGMLAGYARRITVPTLAGRALAVASLGTPVGLAVGTPFGSWLGTTVDWRWSFGTLSVLMALTLVLAVLLVPDAPGQRAGSHLPVHRVLSIPGVAVILVVILAWMVAHNTVYTYISSYLRSAQVPLSVDVALVTFGVAALGGIAVTAALVDRMLRPLLLVSIGLFTAAGVVLLVGQQSLVAVVIAIVCWGLGYGGAATQLQTAVSEASGDNADVANSMLGVAFNLAIFAGGVLGAVLISQRASTTLPAVMVVLPLIALAMRRRRPPDRLPGRPVNRAAQPPGGPGRGRPGSPSDVTGSTGRPRAARGALSSALVVVLVAAAACSTSSPTSPSPGPGGATGSGPPSARPTTSTSAGPGQPSTSSAPPPAGAVPVRVLVGDQAFAAELYDNPTARELADRLPVTLTVADLHGTEKTGRLPFALTTDGVPRGADPEVDELGYYAPGEDLVLYHGDVGYFDGIVRIGRFEDSIAGLGDRPDRLTVTVELA